jgi:predicted neuraminidase
MMKQSTRGNGILRAGRKPALLFSLLVLACAAAAVLEARQKARVVPLTTIDGHSLIMENYDERRGTVVIFLSARSEAVQQEIRRISDIYERYRLRGVLFVGVVPNVEETPAELRTFVQNNGVRFPVYRDLTGEATERFGATVVPELFLLNREGGLVFQGEIGELSQAIQGLLAEVTAEDRRAGDPIGALGGPREIPDPYGDMDFASQLIFRKIPDVAAHHCPTVAEAANGDILALWYGGSYESSDDQALYLSRKARGGRQWAAPRRLVWNPGQPPGNAVIFQFPGGRMGIVWGRMEGSRPVRRGAGWSACRLMMRTSDDNGHTWSEDEEIPGSFGWLPRNVPLTLANGEFVLPVSGRLEEEGSGSFLLVLQEDGRSWKRRGFIPRGSQPTVIQRDNGELLALMRSRPHILQSISTDNGETWSAPEMTVLKNPGSGIAMTRLDSGRVLLAFNDTDRQDRTPFNVIQSFDDGRTWKDMRILEADWGEFSYPSIIQARDGMTHLVYTYRRYSIKHTTFDEGWLTHLERPN